MKKGFTLTELLCVVIIIGILLILAIPSITNLLKDEEKNISDAMNKTILQAGELYIQDNSENYLMDEGNVYCIKLSELVELEYLSNPIKDPVTGNEIDKNHFVKIYVQNGKYNYEYNEVCEIIENE